jgi:hypothetical protein
MFYCREESAYSENTENDINISLTNHEQIHKKPSWLIIFPVVRRGTCIF